jgi:hypothetical protein
VAAAKAAQHAAPAQRERMVMEAVAHVRVYAREGAEGGVGMHAGTHADGSRWRAVEWGAVGSVAYVFHTPK